MIKASDKKIAAQPPASYEKIDQLSFGIAFCRKDGTRRFAPYSFLSAVDFDGMRELTFRFASWTAYVRGEGLLPLWNAVREGNLAQIREVDRTGNEDEPWVRELTFAEFEMETPSSVPPFPGDREEMVTS